MKYLQQLDVSVNGALMESKILATAAGMKKLTLRYDYSVLYNLESLLTQVKQQVNSLPSVINVYLPFNDYEAKNQLLQFWSTWSSKLPSFVIALYKLRIVPINLYPSIPLIKVKFGPAATPPLIKLTNHGILGTHFISRITIIMVRSDKV